MVYNDSSKQWLTCGNDPYITHVFILHSLAADTYRFVGIAEQDGEASTYNANSIMSSLCVLRVVQIYFMSCS